MRSKAWGLVLFSLVFAACNDEGIKATDKAVLEIAPKKFVFPKLGMGASDEKTVVVKNRGKGALVIGDLDPNFDVAQFDLFFYRNGESDDQFELIKDGVNHFSRLEIPGEESITLVLLYAPVDEATPDNNSRIVLDTNVGTANIDIDIEAATAEIAVVPQTLDFGRVAQGDEKTLTTRVTNLGQQPLAISQLAINGSPDFVVSVGDVDAIQDATVLPGAEGGPAGLDPGDSLELAVTYRPGSDGSDLGELSIFNNDPNQPRFNVNLRANGASPCIKVLPVSLDFPPTILDATNTRPITIESCGGEALEIRRIYIKEGSSPAFTVGELPALPAALPAVEEGDPNPSRNVDIRFAPPDQLAYGGTVVVESNDVSTCTDENDPASCVVEVPLVGRGILNACPVPGVAEDTFEVLPLDIIDLDGSPSSDPDGAPDAMRYRWVVVDRPEGSTSEPVERFLNPARPQDGGPIDREETATAVFFVDLAGEYRIELHVIDALGTEAPSETCPEPIAAVSIHAEPNEDIHVQMVWDTPTDRNQTDADGSDVDMHLMHPRGAGWGMPPLDCYFANSNPDWGIQGDPTDDPSLDIDDTDGAGPENINLDNPEDTDRYGNGYHVGVHYFRAELLEGATGPSNVTIRIFLGGQLDYQADRELRATDNFWHVAQIIWTPANKEVVPVDRFFAQTPRAFP